MKQKPYTNFKVPDVLTLETEQQPSKTNHVALDELRKQQMVGRVERPVTGVKTTFYHVADSFNEWSKHINNLLTTKK